MFRLNVVKKVATAGLFAIGASIGLPAAAWAIVVGGLVAVLVNGWAVNRAIGLGIRAQLASAAPSLALASGVGLGVAWAAGAWSVIPVVEVAVLGVAGMTVYLALALVLRTPVLDVLRLLRQRDHHAAD